MSQLERFHDNPSGVITDTKFKNQWLPKDSWGDLGQWRNFDEARSYALTMNQVYAGSYNDWRFPTREEAEGFYEETLSQKDWEGKDIHIHSLFVTQCAHYMWISETNDNQEAARINLRNGEVE